MFKREKMKYKQSFIQTLIVGLCVSLVACGEAPAAGGKPTKVDSKAETTTPKELLDIQKNITQELTKQFPDPRFEVKSVHATPITGLYEVVVSGSQIIYADATGRYMLVGDLLDLGEKRSLTEERLSQLNKVDFATLPLDKAVKEVRGKGELKVAVFTDADCPFCQRLEKEFAKMDNVTIYNFMMPIASLHPNAYQKTVQILCQPDPTKAWTDWMRDKKQPPKVAECENSLDETLALGEKFGFSGTPTLVFPNGKVVSGYMPMPQLEEQIKDNQQ